MATCQEQRIPRVAGVRYDQLTTAQMNALTNPAEGYYIDNTDTGTLWRYSGSVWENTLAINDNAVTLTGDQTVEDVKTFVDGLRIGSAGFSGDVLSLYGNPGLVHATDGYVNLGADTDGNWFFQKGTSATLSTSFDFTAVTSARTYVFPDKGGTVAMLDDVGGSGHTIQEEGTPLTSRANLNFIGSAITVTDNAGNDATNVTITSNVSDFINDAGYITSETDDQIAAEVDFTPAGTIAAATVQAAIEEAASEALQVGTGTVSTTNVLNNDLLLEDLNLTGSATDEYIVTYEETSGGFELVDFPDLSLSGTGNKDLSISYGNTIDLTSVTGISALNLRLHASSPVTVDEFYFGTTAQIAGAGLGSNVAAFPTDSPEAVLLTTDQTITGAKTFSVSARFGTSGDGIAIGPTTVAGFHSFFAGSGDEFIMDLDGGQSLGFDFTNLTAARTLQFFDSNITYQGVSLLEKKFIVPLTAVGGDVATGTGLNFVPIHDNITITRVEASVLTAGTTSVITFDINEDDGTPASILSTKLTIDATERMSDTAATAAVISDASIAAGSFLIIDIDTADSGDTGADPTVTIYYTNN